jgi:phenylacetate-coenzyme A ligase PaaK-like adenylate-forming protein
MSTPVEIAQGIESQLTAPLYGLDPKERHDSLLALLKKELAYACDQNPQFRNYVEHWPIHFHRADTLADLPYLPVGAFKSNPPLALVGANEVKRTLTSSATTGQVPSRVVLDAETAKRMTKGVTTIIKDFIGPARRPYMVIDTPENLRTQGELGARGAAIQGLGSFATETVCCLRRDPEGNTSLDLERLLDCAAKWRGNEVLAYGFTYVIWTQLVQPLQRQGITLDIPNVRVLHSGGWKRLEREAVTKDVFIGGVASVFGCSADRVLDFYGMVENVGIVYPDCEYGNKHVPAFAEVIVRNPLTLEPITAGQQGLVQVCSVLSTSFPGFLVLTDDMAEVIDYDECPCGRRGTTFRFAGRVPKVEVRGCGNLETTRN